MKPLNFSIHINLSLTLKENKASINIEDVDLVPAVVKLPVRNHSRHDKTSPVSKKKTIHDIILQTAKKGLPARRFLIYPSYSIPD